MSFFTNNASDRCPGRINGNPVNGLCEKVCVEAEKVFDACIRQTQEEGITLALTGFNPANRSEERRVGKECRSRWSPYH